MTRSPTGETRILRARPTVERLKRAASETATGEFDLGSGEFYAMPSEPAGTAEVEPIVHLGPTRKLESGERWAGLALALVVVAAAFAFFAPAFGDALLRAKGTRGQSWRVVEVRITAHPKGGNVVIDGVRHGSTPLQLRLPCRNKPIRIGVESPGFLTWGYKGICPAEGGLRLVAKLRRVRKQN